jgi:hypothetical protein
MRLAARFSAVAWYNFCFVVVRRRDFALKLGVNAARAMKTLT